jgi:cytoskeletal protein CcmA (bactofilin family)
MIFRRNRDSGTTPPAQPERQEQPSPQKQETATQGKGPAGPSVLTPDAVLEGNLATEGELHIDGTVHGSVQAAIIVIGAQGSVHGHVVGEEVYVRGRVIGPICGVNVTIVAGGHVEGDILNQTIAIETGAYIDGKIRRTEDPIGEWQRMWYGEEYEDQIAPAAEPLAEGDSFAPLDLGTGAEFHADPGFGGTYPAQTATGLAEPAQDAAPAPDSAGKNADLPPQEEGGENDRRKDGDS